MNIILHILKAKINPFGRNKTLGKPNTEQLLGEWIDVKNIGTEAVKFSDMSLSHTKYNNYCEMIGTDCFWIGGNNSLKAGQIVRIHTGILQISI